MRRWRRDCRFDPIKMTRCTAQKRVTTRLASFLALAGLPPTPLLLRAQSVAGACLRFNGTNSYVSVPHNAALNAFPLTITAWVKTLRNSSQVDGIVSRYFDVFLGNGYSINLRNGNMYAWYLRSGGSVVVNPFGLDGGFIADGDWHHIAFVGQHDHRVVVCGRQPEEQRRLDRHSRPAHGDRTAPDRSLFQLRECLSGGD